MFVFAVFNHGKCLVNGERHRWLNRKIFSHTLYIIEEILGLCRLVMVDKVGPSAPIFLVGLDLIHLLDGHVEVFSGPKVIRHFGALHDESSVATKLIFVYGRLVHGIITTNIPSFHSAVDTVLFQW